MHVENLTTKPHSKDDQYIRAFMDEVVSVFKDIAQLNRHLNQVASNVFDEPDKLADFAAAVSTGEVGELRDVLESSVLVVVGYGIAGEDYIGSETRRRRIRSY